MPNKNKFTCTKVMVIDDAQIDRYIAGKVIEKYSFAQEVIESDSAENALGTLHAMKQHPEELPNIIFLDIEMPKMDGFDFLEKYQELPDEVKDSCKVVLLSSSIDKNDYMRAYASYPVSSYVHKPLNGEKLSQLIKAIA